MECFIIAHVPPAVATMIAHFNFARSFTDIIRLSIRLFIFFIAGITFIAFRAFIDFIVFIDFVAFVAFIVAIAFMGAIATG
jgi:ABC-type polysaccharide/polyol phosphate export permease